MTKVDRDRTVLENSCSCVLKTSKGSKLIAR